MDLELILVSSNPDLSKICDVKECNILFISDAKQKKFFIETIRNPTPIRVIVNINDIHRKRLTPTKKFKSSVGRQDYFAQWLIGLPYDLIIVI